MKNHHGMALVFAALLSCAPQIAVSQADATDTFIKGTTDFLLDRANDNLIYIFQKKLEANPFLEKYLPATLRLVKAGDIQSLISNKELWRQALERDLIGDGDRLFAKAVDEWTKYVNKVCKDADAELAAACKDALAQLGKVVERQVTKKSAASGASAAAKPPNPERALVYMFSPGATRALGDLTRDLSDLNPEACQELKVGKYTACMVEILAILQAVSHADYVVNCYLYGMMCSRRNENANPEEDGDFSNFRRYALFFAQLADAANTRDRAQVNALLKSVTVPPVSFGIKREPHATRVLITAYLGGVASRETGSSHTAAGGLVAPVGFELSQATDRGNSFSLLLSPLDFGYPLTLKMKNTDTTIKGSDVVVPAVYLLYGLKNYPLAAGFGYSRGRGIDNPDQRVGRILFMVAFDMPLFKLY